MAMCLHSLVVRAVKNNFFFLKLSIFGSLSLVLSFFWMMLVQTSVH